MDICGYMRVCDGEFTLCYDGWSYAIGCDVMATVGSLKKREKNAWMLYYGKYALFCLFIYLFFLFCLSLFSVIVIFRGY